MALPKALIKKYGVSKRAWAEYRKTKNKTKSRGVSVAKRKVSKKRSSIRKSGGMNNVVKIIAGAGLASLYEVFVSPMIPLGRNIKNMIELGLGILLSFQRNTYLKSAGIALIVINTFEILTPIIQNMRNKTPSSALSGGSVDALLQG